MEFRHGLLENRALADEVEMQARVCLVLLGMRKIVGEYWTCLTVWGGSSLSGETFGWCQMPFRGLPSAAT